MKTKILIADDHESIRDVIRFALESEGFEVLEAHNGTEALKLFEANQPSLVVLDVMMPGYSGLEVCKNIRRISDVPIIFVSSKDEELDRILGLELGGDDYLTKPFSPRELTIRCKIILNRRRLMSSVELLPKIIKSNTKSIGHLKLDFDRFEASWNGQSIVLTSTEFSILQTLIRHPGKVYSRDEIIDLAYEGLVSVSDRTIDSHIRRLRKKFPLQAEVVETMHGFGYRLGPCV